MNERPPTDRQPACQPWPLSRLLHEHAIAMGMALERSSQTAYNSHLNSYIAFCRIHQRPLTPTVDTLSFFIVKHTLAGCIKHARQQPSRKSPLDPTLLLTTTQNLTPESQHDDKLFTALLVTGFHALMRLGELMWPNTIQLQSLRKIVLRRLLRTMENSYSFILPTHKALKAGHGEEILVRAFTTTVNPLPILLKYMHSHDHLFFYAPALWLTRDGAIPTRTWFMRRFWRFFGSEFAGHSM